LDALRGELAEDAVGSLWVSAVEAMARRRKRATGQLEGIALGSASQALQRSPRDVGHGVESGTGIPGTTWGALALPPQQPTPWQAQRLTTFPRLPRIVGL